MPWQQKSENNEIDWDIVDEWLEEEVIKISYGAMHHQTMELLEMANYLVTEVGEKIDDLKPTQLMQKALEISRKKMSAPIFGKQKVYDGKTGVAFENQVLLVVYIWWN